MALTWSVLHEFRHRCCVLAFEARRFAQHTPNYLPPTLDLAELEKPLDSQDPRNFNPIRAPVETDCPTVFNYPLVQKFTNMIMRDGRRMKAQRVMLNTFENIKRRQVKKFLQCENEEERTEIECNPMVIFETSVQNCTPILTLSPVKRGGITYQVPGPITEKNARFRALQYIRENARDKGNSEKMEDSLANELMDAFNNTGRSVRRKQELHRQAEANRAYVHYRWAKSKGKS